MMDVCACECRCLGGQKRVVKAPGAGVKCVCEPPEVDSGNQTQVYILSH